MTSILMHEKDPRSSVPIRGLFPLGVLGALAVQNRFSKLKWKVEWKIDGNYFPLGRLGSSKIVGKIAHWLSRKWNFLSTTKNSQWKIEKNKQSETNRQGAKDAKKNQEKLQ